MRKDLRNPLELKRWNPSAWSPEKIRKYMHHVEEQIVLECRDFVGVYDGALVAAEAIARWSTVVSQTELLRRGVLLIGEMIKHGNTSTTPRE